MNNLHDVAPGFLLASPAHIFEKSQMYLSSFALFQRSARRESAKSDVMLAGYSYTVPHC